MPESTGMVRENADRVTQGTFSIIKDPASYTGMDLVLKGKIAIVCSSGCWFLIERHHFVDARQSLYGLNHPPGKVVVV